MANLLDTHHLWTAATMSRAAVPACRANIVFAQLPGTDLALAARSVR